MDILKQKEELRQQMRALRLAMTPAEVHARSATIWERLAVFAPFTEAKSLFVYVSHGNEVMTHGLIQQLLAMGRAVGVPLFDRAARQYRASLVQEFPGDLVEGQLQILEPRPDRIRPIGLDQFEMLLVPGLAFDAPGHRLGHGKGYFDRMLGQATGTKVALAYDFQVIAEVPFGSHDVPMDHVVTEVRLINCRGK